MRHVTDQESSLDLPDEIRFPVSAAARFDPEMNRRRQTMADISLPYIEIIVHTGEY
jgi:hypothetical protein